MKCAGGDKKVTVVIPCYNEAHGIARVIERFPHDALLKNGIQLTVCVIDNNSTDDTAAIARAAGAIVVHEPKKGKGNALRTGFRSVPDDTDYVVMLDGDDTYSPEEILRVLEPLQSDFCDAVIGSRLSGRIQNKAMSPRNRWGNKLFTSAVRVMYRANVSDVLTGYFAWKKPALRTLEPYITSAGFAIEMEMITKMARLDLRLASVPISYHPRAGSSNLHPYRDGYRILMMCLRNLFWRPRRQAVESSFTPRKIVFVSDAVYPYFKGGKEKRLYEIAKHLALMGHDVHIYTMHWWESADRVRRESGVYLHAICKYHDMYRNGRRTVKEGILFGLACFKLFSVRFDILDVDHMPFFPIFSTWIVCALRGRKLHATWHEALSYKEWVDYMGPKGIVASLLERLSTLLPYRITAASGHTQELLAANHGRVRRVELVASGIDAKLMQTLQPAATACDVLYVGRLVKDKNVDKLIAAISIAVKSYPSIQCLIVGEGPEKVRLQKQAASLHLKQNITFLSHVEESEDVYAYMKAAKVFCSPSVREGFGIVSLEALGCGTPVITSNSLKNAARHLISDGQNGSVVPLSPNALAEAILHWVLIAQKPNTAGDIAHYDWRQLAEKQSEVYSL